MIYDPIREATPEEREWHMKNESAKSNKMSITLYQIEKDILEISQAIMDQGGEITEEQNIALALTEKSLSEKGAQYGYVILDAKSNINRIEAEIERLNSLKKANETLVKALSTRVKSAMDHFGMTEIKTPTLKMNFRKSESVEIINIDQIPSTYIKTTIDTAPDKKALIKALKDGEVIGGAVIKINSNLQIK